MQCLLQKPRPLSSPTALAGCPIDGAYFAPGGPFRLAEYFSSIQRNERSDRSSVGLSRKPALARRRKKAARISRANPENEQEKRAPLLSICKTLQINSESGLGIAALCWRRGWTLSDGQ
jgi:hypothetical protein